MNGRGRLSSIELLGEDYDDIVTWAAGELRERKQLQIDILPEFNKRLRARAEEIGDDEFRPISRSAFGRHAFKLAGYARRLDQTREISRALVDRLGPGDPENSALLIGEIIKSAIYERLGEDGEAGTTMKELMAAASALKASAQAQKISSDRRAQLLKEAEAAEAKAAERAVSAVEKVASEAGLSADRIAQLRRDFLGVRDTPKAVT